MPNFYEICGVDNKKSEFFLGKPTKNYNLNRVQKHKQKTISTLQKISSLAAKNQKMLAILIDSDKVNDAQLDRIFSKC